MIRFILLSAALCAALFLSLAVRAGEPARLSFEHSAIAQSSAGTEIRLALSQGVPFRVFTLDRPARLVIDFQGLDGQGEYSGLLNDIDAGVDGLRFGIFQPGWTRLVADLNRPMLPADVGMSVDPLTGASVLQMTLARVSAEDFARLSGPPQGAGWPRVPEIAERRSDTAFVVVLDPGHGGIDPGAERNGITEKTLMLEMALNLRDMLEAHRDVEVVLTRDRDVFVSLQARVSMAHQVGADLFVSLHADALSEGGAHGATVYTLSETASDAASAHLAERHNRADIIAGLDLKGADDEITGVLLDLARRETAPRSAALARAFVDHMAAAGGPMNRRPLREAGFSVLKSADIPSVLIEVGFLSSQRDLENLRKPEWRQRMAEGMARAILAWRETDAAHRALVRR